MLFTFKEKEEYEDEMRYSKKGESDFAEIVARKCYICKINEWNFDVGHSDNETFDYLYNLDCQDGYAFVCKDCFDQHFGEHYMKYVGLWY